MDIDYLLVKWAKQVNMENIGLGANISKIYLHNGGGTAHVIRVPNYWPFPEAAKITYLVCTLPLRQRDIVVDFYVYNQPVTQPLNKWFAGRNGCTLQFF